MKDDLGNHLKDLLFHLVHWLSITLFLRKTSQEPINLERKSWIVPRIRFVRGREFGRVTYLVADLVELETMDASEIDSKRLECKRGDIFPNTKENLFFQSQMDESNFLEEIRN